MRHRVCQPIPRGTALIACLMMTLICLNMAVCQVAQCQEVANPEPNNTEGGNSEPSNSVLDSPELGSEDPDSADADSVDFDITDLEGPEIDITEFFDTKSKQEVSRPNARGGFDPTKVLRVQVVWPIMDEKPREWTDRSGEKRTAVLGGRSPKTAIFYTTEGRRYELAPDELSPADFRYFINRTQKRVNQTAVIALGKVEKVRFGDSFYITTAEQKKELVRLAGIDAPDSRQPFGSEATTWLSRFKGKNVRVEYFERDKHGRLVGDVYIGDRWMNYEMVLAGYAWHDHRTNVDRRLSGAQEYAKEQKRGLWASPNATSPWDFREQSSKSRSAPADQVGQSAN